VSEVVIVYGDDLKAEKIKQTINKNKLEFFFFFFYTTSKMKDPTGMDEFVT